MHEINRELTKSKSEEVTTELSLGEVDEFGSRLFIPVFIAILLIQGFQFAHETIGHIIKITIHGRNIPWNSWWMIPDYRALLWLLATPALAVIILKWKWPLRYSLIAHLLLFGTLVFLSGLLVYPIEQLQFYETTLLRFGPDGLAQIKTLFSSLNTDPTELKFQFWFWCSELCDGIVTYSLMSAIGYLVLHINLRIKRKQQSERLQHSLDRLQHQALCNRLQPHFLFNTLNMIGSLASKDPNSARACIFKLSVLLRHSLESLPEQEVNLEQEFEILECYLQIQKMRYGDKFDFEVEIEESVTDAKLPAFVLQPLVENCFMHGFRDKEDVGYIGVFATKQGRACRLEVVDNGAKFEPGQALDEHFGIGLTRERLKLQYKDRAGVYFQPVEPCGLRAVVVIPFGNDEIS